MSDIGDKAQLLELYELYKRLKLTKEEEKKFSALPDFHKIFILSLGSGAKLKMSLKELCEGDKEANARFNYFVMESVSGVFPIMSVQEVMDLIFPFTWYFDERWILGGQLLFCIERGGLRASGVKWYEIEPDEEIIFSSFENRKNFNIGKSREKLLKSRIHIDDVEAKIVEGAFQVDVANYLQIWRLYLDKKAKGFKREYFESEQSNVGVIEKSEQSNVGVIKKWEERVIDAYEELRSIKKVRARGIIREDTNEPAGFHAIRRVINKNRSKS